MRFKMHGGCGPRRFNGIPEAILAMGLGGRGWRGGFDPDNWHFEFGGPPGRGGGRRRMFDSGELRLVLLRLIADQPRHGYDLIRAIAPASPVRCSCPTTSSSRRGRSRSASGAFAGGSGGAGGGSSAKRSATAAP